MSDYEKALVLVEELVDGADDLEPDVVVKKISQLSATIDNMKVIDATNVIKYMKELIVLKVPEEKRELIKKYL